MKNDIFELSQATSDLSDKIGHFQLQDGSMSLAVTESTAYQLTSELALNYRQLCYSIGGQALTNYAAFQTDMDTWLENGLTTAPDFTATHDSWQMNHSPIGLTPFISPMRVPNSFRGGDFMLTFALVGKYQYSSDQCNETTSRSTALVTEPKFADIVNAPVRNAVYKSGEGSVMFSELTAATNRSGPQTFGAFIINDFKRRYQTMTLKPPFELGPQLESLLSEEEMIPLNDERAVWLRTHDAFHETGELPHSSNIKMKMKFAPAVLDELKADTSAFRALSEQGAFWERAAIRQISDKMFRFPYSPYGYRSVDAAVGEIIFRKALNDRALFRTSDGLKIDVDKLNEAITDLQLDSLNVEEATSRDQYFLNCTEYLQIAEVKSGKARVQLTTLPV